MLMFGNYSATQFMRSLTVLEVRMALSVIFTPKALSKSDATLIRSSELKPISVLRLACSVISAGSI